ncbi:hypothetical protein BJX64DRAFT_271972 [Aspergillus heterothallicus]
MYRTKHFLALIVAAAGLPLGLSGKECYAKTSSWPGEILLSSPEDLQVFDGCTTIIGDIRIKSGFTGNIALNSVTNFTGKITAENPWSKNIRIDSIEMPDAMYVRDILLWIDAPVKKVYLPKVESMDRLYVYQCTEESFLDLASLRQIEGMILNGSWKNLSLPSLETAGRISILGDVNEGPVDIHFPRLREARGLQIETHITSLYTPNLHTLGAVGISIEATKPDLAEVSLPSLSTIEPGNGIYLQGHIRRIDLGLLSGLQPPIVIATESPADIVSAVQIANEVRLSGKLRSLNFTRLSYARRLEITSTIPTRCSPKVVQEWHRLHRPLQATFCDEESLRLATPTPSPSSSTPVPYYSYTPTPTPTPVPSPGGLWDVKFCVTIPLVYNFVGIFVVAVVAAWYYQRRQHKEEQKAAKLALEKAYFDDCPSDYREDLKP